MTEKYSVVIDNGSGYCKAGLSTDLAPRIEFPTIVGKPRVPSIMVGMDQKQAFIGHQAETKKGVLFLKRPIQHGIITNWEDMVKIWHHTFYNELKTTPQDHPCLLTQTPKNPKANRQKMTEIMFETFNVPSLYIAIQSVLSLYQTGSYTGLVLDSGAGVTHTVPIYEGYALPHAVQKNNFAGNSVDKYLHSLLNEAGMKFSYSAQSSIIRDIKEKHAFVWLDEKNDSDCAYTLPDGKIITLGNQRFKCTEVMFNPASFNFEMPAFHEMVHQSIKKCDFDVRKYMYTNVVLSGGSTMLPGMPQRLERQLTCLVPSNTPVNINATPQRKYSAWLGGSLLSSLSTFTSMGISKSEFIENGASIVHKKFF